MPDDQTRPKPRSVTRAEFDRLAAAVADLQRQIEADRAARIALDRRIDEDRAMRHQTHDRVEKMYGALMEATPGQTMSLLDRMASATIDIESGQRVAHLIIKMAGLLTAFGGIIGAAYVAIRFGSNPKP
jgi:hypothetical protein